MLREKGSNVAHRSSIGHDTSDPLCTFASLAALDDDACCPICGERLAREQAASAINLRELGS